MENPADFTIGMIAYREDQAYELIGFKPYIRQRDGQPITLLVWRTHCLACGVMFEATTLCREFKYANRRCPKHVTRGRLRRLREARCPGAH